MSLVHLHYPPLLLSRVIAKRYPGYPRVTKAPNICCTLSPEGGKHSSCHHEASVKLPNLQHLGQQQQQHITGTPAIQIQWWPWSCYGCAPWTIGMKHCKARQVNLTWGLVNRCCKPCLPMQRANRVLNPVTQKQASVKASNNENRENCLWTLECFGGKLKAYPDSRWHWISWYICRESVTASLMVLPLWVSLPYVVFGWVHYHHDLFHFVPEPTAKTPWCWLRRAPTVWPFAASPSTASMHGHRKLFSNFGAESTKLYQSVGANMFMFN